MKKFLQLTLMLLLSVGVSFGQAISVNGGSIQGTITDPSGASIPNASIEITSPETGYSKTLQTDSAGFYSVGPLNPGAYTVHVAAAGFQNLQVKTVVRTGTATTGSFKMTLGMSSETIEVTAGAVQVNTDQIQVSDVITQNQIDTLPVNGRNFLDVAQIEPGVILQQGSSFDPTKAGYSALSISGVSGRTTRILLDGQDITDEFVGTTMFNVSEGSISEFQLNRSTQDVSGDVTSTGQVLVSTRTGTNKVHGLLFYNFQDARALFANQNFGFAQPAFQRNQYGGSIGGPIFRDKLFFFANAERIQQKQAAASKIGANFAAVATQYPTYPSPLKDTYEAGRLDYNGPWGIHYFVRGNYNFNGSVSNFNNNFQLYNNRDNTYGFAGGADFATGKFTHSFRGSYEKFHNFIADDTIGNGTIYDPIPLLTITYTTQKLFTGPNVDAPQGTFQSDKQFRYDGTWTRGAHIFKFGASVNRVQVAAFAAFFGLAPRVSLSDSGQLLGTVTTQNPNGLGCKGVAGAAPCLGDLINGYNSPSVRVGNGEGFSTEVPNFGLGGGGGNAWRAAGYIGDSWKAMPRLTITAGLRYSVDTNRENNDLAQPTCGDLSSNLTATAANNPCTGLSTSTGLFTLYNAGFTGKVHQPYANFAPQVGLNYAPDSKTSLRAGFGIYYENVVFNNTSNARDFLLKQGGFTAYPSTVCTSGITFPDNKTTATSIDAAGNINPATGGVLLSDLCKKYTIAQAAPYFVNLQKAYQASTVANAVSINGAYIGNTLNASGLYGPNYKTPYSEQWNFGVQREVFKGAVISADYVHNSTLKIGQTLDSNHLGAARNFNKANATTAVAATILACTPGGGGSVASVTAAGGCQGLHPNKVVSGVTVVGSPATISDFAAKGLDSQATYVGAGNLVSAGKSNAGAFTGNNPLLGSGAFIQPIGRSGYDALQVVYRQQKSHPLPFVTSGNLQVSYNLSRIVSTSGAGTSDQFFTNAAIDNDNPSAYMGRSGLDKTQQLSFGGSFLFKYGPRMGAIGHFYSAAPGNLALDAATTQGGIFQTDVSGDGTVGDLAPGTLPGYYMHQVKGNNLQGFINNFNATQAGKLTPAGQAVVNSGLFTQQQLVSIGGAIQRVADTANGTGLNNPTFRALDVNFSYPIPLGHFVRMLGEGATLEPSIAFYNVANFSNFSAFTTTLYNTATAGASIANLYNPATYTGTSGVTGQNNFNTLSSNRVQRGTGTFDQGAPRSAEFSLKLNF